MLSPLPETEKLLKMHNMKSYQCAILQLCDPAGTPYIDTLVYALFFNQLAPVTTWVCTGEFNKDGIFHVHVMFKTNARSDSLRRCMDTAWRNLCLSDNFTYHFGNQSTFDCLKIQRCHKPESMLGYLMKAPSFIMSNDLSMLQLCYDIDGWNLNDRFKQTPEAETSSDINSMTQHILDIILQNGCKTMEDCFKSGGEIMSKYLHKPGLQAIVNNCLTFVKSTGGAWSVSIFEKYDPNPTTIHKILLFQGIQPSTFDDIFWQWLTKADSKRNCICIRGPSNTGKSAFISGLKACIPWGEIVNTNTFAFEGILDCVVGVWEEPLCSPELAEKAKQVLEGMPCSIPVKYKKPQLLPRTPIIVTTNHDLWRFCQAEEQMFKNRMWIIDFKHNCRDQFYVPRTSEPSCQCGYCAGSRGREGTSGSTSPGRLSSGEQPICPEQHSGTEQSSNVGSGPMLGAGEGTSGCSGSSESSSDQLSSNRAESSFGSSSGAEQHMGSFRIIPTRDHERRHSSIRERLESIISGGHSRDDSTSDGSGSKRGIKRGIRFRDGKDQEESDSSSDVGSRAQNIQTGQKIPVSAKRQRLGRTLVSTRMKYRIENSDNVQQIPMYVPLKSDWQEYLSWLAHINSPETLDISIDINDG